MNTPEPNQALTVRSSQEIAPLDPVMLSKLVLDGNLSGLNPAQKVQYYVGYCQRLGLDPATKPLDILKLQGKEILYATRACTQQLSKLHGVSHAIVDRREDDGCFIVTARAFIPASGRQTESIGAVNIAGLKGEQRCNAMMKAETKAKRRATLDLLGLGLTDESEVGSIPGALPSNFDPMAAPVAMPERPPLTLEAPQPAKPPLAPPPPAKTPGKANGGSVKPLQERIEGMKAKLGSKLEWAVGYLRSWTISGSDANASLMPNEGLDSLTEADVNWAALHWSDFMARLDAYIEQNKQTRQAGDQLEGAEVPTESPVKPAHMPSPGPSVQGIIEAISLKEGTSKRGAWTLFGIKIGDKWFSTFSRSLGKHAEKLKGEAVELFYEEGEKGDTAKAIAYGGQVVEASEQ